MSILHDGFSHQKLGRREKKNTVPVVVQWPPISTADLPIDIVLQRLERVTRSSAGQFSALCPAHGDSHSSLSIGETDDGVVLIYCHAGCAPEKVVEAIGLQMQNLFPSGFALRRAARSARQICSSTLLPANPIRSVVDSGSFAPDFAALALTAYSIAAETGSLRHLGVALGIGEAALHTLGVGLVVRGADHYWTFPERNDRGAVVGILLRHVVSHNKTSWPGGYRGLYIPATLPSSTPDIPIFIAEGASDTIAMLSQGLPTIGRAAARPSGQAAEWLCNWLRANLAPSPGRRIVVVGDNDDAGRDGAAVTAEVVRSVTPNVVTAFPPSAHNDVREWITSGTFTPNWPAQQTP